MDNYPPVPPQRLNQSPIFQKATPPIIPQKKINKEVIQWIIRLVISSLIFLPFFIPGLSSGHSITSEIITFIASTLILTGILHIISIIPLFRVVSHFKKYIFIFGGMIVLAVVVFFSVVLYQVFLNHGPSRCESICGKRADYSAASCYDQCAIQNKNVVACENIKSGVKDAVQENNIQNYRNHCFAYASISSHQFSCDKISGGDEDRLYKSKNVCYENFAVENKDISLCDNIPFYSWYLGKYSCYQKVAIALQDPSLCVKIPDIYPIAGHEKDGVIINSLKEIKSDCFLLNSK